MGVLDVVEIKNLVKSMQNCLKAIIEAKGDPTKY
jgi:hypothetical protein